jgi:hypothetical protein
MLSFRSKYGRGATKFNMCDEKLLSRGGCDGKQTGRVQEKNFMCPNFGSGTECVREIVPTCPKENPD